MNDLAKREYVGDGRQCLYEPRDKHPRDGGLWPEQEPYIADKSLANAVNIALYLRRPLLLEGEPGCGKTRLAYSIAHELGYPLYPCYIRSTNQAQDLLYEYDALGRLYDLQEKKIAGEQDDHTISPANGEYDLNLMSLDSADTLPAKGKSLVVVAKIGDFYHARIFDQNGNKVIDKGKNEFWPDETLVQQLETELSSQSINNQTKTELIQKITSSLGNKYPREKYVTLGKLGEAIKKSDKENIPSVVLIDEIDKADIDFPNDLLLELDRLQFEVKEVPGMKFDALKGESRNERKDFLPLIIITSNQEKELPKPFLRRCLFYFIEFPKKDILRKIIDSHSEEFIKSPFQVKTDSPQLTRLFEVAIGKFFTLRELKFWRKKAGTSEFLDWVKVLEREQIKASELDKMPLKELPHLETLVKTQSDQSALAKFSSGG